MWRSVLLAVIGLAALGGAACFGYEFRLLNGMTLNGELKSFSDGRFLVDTEFGAVVIEADKLDYIIVEESDPGPRCPDGGAPGLGLGQLSGPAGDAMPAPLSSRSIPPAPPAPLRSRSIEPAEAYPGLFRG